MAYLLCISKGIQNQQNFLLNHWRLKHGFVIIDLGQKRSSWGDNHRQEQGGLDRLEFRTIFQEIPFILYDFHLCTFVSPDVRLGVMESDSGNRCPYRTRFLQAYPVGLLQAYPVVNCLQTEKIRFAEAAYPFFEEKPLHDRSRRIWSFWRGRSAAIPCVGGPGCSYSGFWGKRLLSGANADNVGVVAGTFSSAGEADGSDQDFHSDVW